jgi:hypothetical protein
MMIIAWTICQRLGIKTLLQRFELVRPQQALLGAVSLEAQELAAQAGGWSQWAGWVVSASP